MLDVPIDKKIRLLVRKQYDRAHIVQVFDAVRTIRVGILRYYDIDFKNKKLLIFRRAYNIKKYARKCMFLFFVCMPAKAKEKKFIKVLSFGDNKIRSAKKKYLNSLHFHSDNLDTPLSCYILHQLKYLTADLWSISKYF